MARCFFCLSHEPGAERLLVAQTESLDETIEALNVKLLSLSYQCTQLMLEARQFKAAGDRLRCLQKLRQREEKQRVYARWVGLYENVCRVRDSIDDAHALGDISTTMGVANQVLQEALLKVDVEKIDSLMDQLSEGMARIDEVGQAMGGTVDEFDEERAWAELDNPPPEPELPVAKLELNPLVSKAGPVRQAIAN